VNQFSVLLVYCILVVVFLLAIWFTLLVIIN